MKPGRRTLALITAVLGTVVLLVTLTAGTASAGITVPRVHAVTGPPVGKGLAYAAHTRALSANGTSSSGVTCPAGTLPVGGGTGVQNPLIEHVVQAGFVASAATGEVAGYEASVRVSGLARGASVRFAVQVACVASATTSVIYAVHTQMLSADGTSSSGVVCPVGTVPVGGGAATQDPLAEDVAQAGFAVTTATGKVDGFEASVQVSGLAPGTSVRFAVQVACLKAATPPVYGPPTMARSASGISS